MTLKSPSFQIIIAALIVILFNHQAFNQSIDESFRQDSLIKLGDSLANLDNWDQSGIAYKIARNHFEESSDWEGYIYSLNRIGFCYRRSRDFDSAYYYLTKAMKDGEDYLGINHPELGRTYYNLGYYYTTAPDRNDSIAEMYRKKSVEIRVKSLPYYHNDLAQSYHGLASFYLFDDNVKAIDNYSKAVEIREAILDDNHPDLAYSYQFLGTAYRNIGDFYRASNYLEKAVRIYELNPNASPTLVGIALNNLANSYFSAEHYLKAKETYETALSFRINVQEYDSLDLLQYLGNYGQALTFLEDYEVAEKLYSRLIQLNTNPIYDSVDLALNYEQYAIFFMKTGDFKLSRTYFEKALELNSTYSETFRLLADLEVLDGRYDDAINSYQNAIRKLEPVFNHEDVNTNPNAAEIKNPIELFYLISGMANSYYLLFQNTLDLDYLIFAISHYEYLDGLSDIIKNGYFTDDLKLDIGELFKQNIINAMQCITIYNLITGQNRYVELAFRFMEKSRYSQVFLNLNKIQAVTNTDIPDSIYRKEKDLAFQIKEMEDNILASRLGAELNEFEDAKFKLERQYQDLQDFLIEYYPSYYQVKYDSTLLSIGDLQSKMESNTQVFEFVWSDSLVFVLTVGKNTAQLHKLKIDSQLIEHISNYQKYLNDIPSMEQSLQHHYSNFSLASHGIYQYVLKPFLLDNISRLIISPDGPLALIPFESLITNQKTHTFKDAPYLMNEVNLQYAYNINLLLKNTRQGHKSDNRILAFSYSDSNESDVESERGTLSEIPSSAKELLAINKIFGGKSNAYFTGSDATESTFKSLSSDYDIIHLAVHGEADPKEDVNSRLIFKSSLDSMNDGDLYAYELYNLQLNNVSLAVLSACETGLGMEVPGEGIYSIAHGFSYAGCPSTIMSLWRISDVTSAQIIEKFYHHLSSGMGTSESLRQAKIDYIKEAKSSSSLPYYWAGFVSLGDTSPIIEKRSFLGINWFWFLPFILILGLWYWRKKG